MPHQFGHPMVSGNRDCNRVVAVFGVELQGALELLFRGVQIVLLQLFCAGKVSTRSLAQLVLAWNRLDWMTDGSHNVFRCGDDFRSLGHVVFDTCWEHEAAQETHTYPSTAEGCANMVGVDHPLLS